MLELARIRNERGVSQRKLAELSGVNYVTIALIETGKRNPSVATLEKLAAALDVETGDLFPKDQPPLFPVARPATREEQADLDFTAGASKAELRAAHDAALDALEELGEPSIRRVERPDAPLSEAERERFAARRSLERSVILFGGELRRRERLEAERERQRETRSRQR